MRLKTYKVPVWASKLIREICNEEGIHTVPLVIWKKRDTTHTTGHAWRAIDIIAGTNKKNCKEAVIHEMCHHIQYRKRMMPRHDAEFYALLYRIGKAHNIGAAYIKSTEKWYKPRGVKQGYALYLRRQREV